MAVKNIDNNKYIKDCVYPRNFDGSCGFVGETMVFNWDENAYSTNYEIKTTDY